MVALVFVYSIEASHFRGENVIEGFWIVTGIDWLNFFAFSQSLPSPFLESFFPVLQWLSAAVLSGRKDDMFPPKQSTWVVGVLIDCFYGQVYKERCSHVTCTCKNSLTWERFQEVPNFTLTAWCMFMALLFKFTLFAHVC